MNRPTTSLCRSLAAAAGSVGLVAGLSVAPALAATKPALVTQHGAVATKPANGTFVLKVVQSREIVMYTAKTTFLIKGKKGTAAGVRVGDTVAVTGTLSGTAVNERLTATTVTDAM